MKYILNFILSLSRSEHQYVCEYQEQTHAQLFSSSCCSFFFFAYHFFFTIFTKLMSDLKTATGILKVGALFVIYSFFCKARNWFFRFTRNWFTSSFFCMVINWFTSKSLLNTFLDTFFISFLTYSETTSFETFLIFLQTSQFVDTSLKLFYQILTIGSL